MRRNRLFRVGLLSILLLLTISTSWMVTPVSAYGTGDGTSDDPHDWITDQALTVLYNDGYVYIKNEISQYVNKIKEGSYVADHGSDILNIPVSASEHYHDPYFHIGLLGIFKSAAQYAQEHFESAINYYRDGDKEHAYFQLGFAVHVLQDLTVPHHAALAPLNNHQEYEKFIYDKKSYITAVTSGGKYSFSSYSGHYTDDNAWGWVDYNAHKSIYYYQYVDGGADDDWDFAAAVLLPWAVKTTAGFFRFFYTEANRGREISGSFRQDYLSSSGDTYTYYIDNLAWGPYTVSMAGNEPASDFDLYVKWGSSPTTSDYDGRGFSSDSLEVVTVTGSGRLYIMVRSWTGSGHFKVNAIYGSPRTNVRKYGSLSGTDDSETFSTQGTTRNGFMHAWVYLAGPDTSDFDLYIRWQYAPTTSAGIYYDDRGFSIYSQEICDKDRTSSTTLYAMAYAYSGSGSFVLVMLIF